MLIALVLGAIVVFLAPGTATAASVQQQGYIPMADGTQLAYTVELPAPAGRFPVALVYDGYCEGSDPLTCNDPNSASALLGAGYAVLGVSIRGTGCSTGTFDPFTAQEWSDGAAAIEWAAAQPWSDGHVGMFGDSFPGITQLGVAALRPPHLDAIAPFQVTSDIYRDVAYPGGIFNNLFGSFWGLGDQPAADYVFGIHRGVTNADAGCVQAQPAHAIAEPAHNIFLGAAEHPYDDAFWQARAPGAGAAQIRIPVLACLTWQDDEVGSNGNSYLDKLNPATTWVIASNGYHGQCEDAAAVTAQLVSFFNRFVRGTSGSFEATPHVQIWHETTEDSAGNIAPSWITTFRAWKSILVRPVALYLSGGGQLTKHPPASANSASYAYPMLSSSTEDGAVGGQHNALWKGAEPPAGSLSFTTSPLTADAEFLGPASVDLWLSSTARDTDLQVTLTEVRPDGQELYVARGWLRASDRTLDQRRSTPLDPVLADQAAETKPLIPGQPTYMRIEIDPFDHVFRAGSSIRLWVDAPTGETGGWGFDYLKTPAVNTVFLGAQHDSRIVLGQLPDARATTSLPTCDTLLNQPCRTNLVAPPRGSLTVG